jgi:hypothetical protein
MKSVRLICVSAMAGFALLAMPLGLAAQRQQEANQQQPRLFVMNSEGISDSSPTSADPQGRVDGESGSGLHHSISAGGTVDYVNDGISTPGNAVTGMTGNCVFICGSVRCGELTGSCSGLVSGVCRGGTDRVHCPVGRPAMHPGRNACSSSVDTARRCTP